MLRGANFLLSFRHLAPVLMTPLLLGACASSEGDGEGESELPNLSELSEGWNTLEPGGDTTCAKGDDFKYFVRPGSVNKVVIDFAGGGACWSQETCIFGDGLFRTTIDAEDYPFVEDEGEATGYYDHSREDNPIKDWHHVFIPYCTGDLHWGNVTQTYGSGKNPITIHHRGAVNVQAVLDWVYEQFESPDQVLVTGFSAGGYGAAMWSAHVRRHYGEDVPVSQFSDSAAGVIQPAFFAESVPNWEPDSAFPLWIPGGDPGDEGSLAAIYTAIADYYPDMVLSQFNTSYDAEQAKYYVLLGGADAEEWSSLMNTSVSEIESNTENFSSFTAQGDVHTIVVRDDFYSLETEGVALVDWLSEVIDGMLPESVHCTDCGAPQ